MKVWKFEFQTCLKFWVQSDSVSCNQLNTPVNWLTRAWQFSPCQNGALWPISIGLPGIAVLGAFTQRNNQRSSQNNWLELNSISYFKISLFKKNLKCKLFLVGAICVWLFMFIICCLLNFVEYNLVPFFSLEGTVSNQGISRIRHHQI